MIASIHALTMVLAAAAAQDDGWPRWRGPQQDGRSHEGGLPERIELGGAGYLWSYELGGRGTPVVHDGLVYVLGYEGTGPDLQEVLACLDAESGELRWERRFNDFLSDTAYDRYSIGAPALDLETGKVYVLSSAGELVAFGAEGETLWKRVLGSEYGRMTFVNGRTGAPALDGELVIVHALTSHWGPLGPGRDRFLAFDKGSGDAVWVSTPGETPLDNSFSHPLFAWQDGRRVFYAGTGCGNVVCVDARTGDPLWRFKLSMGGVNSSFLLHGDALIAVHGRENLDSSVLGRMVKLRTGAAPAAGAAGPLVLGAEHELWRNDLVAFSSSPALVGDRVYVTDATGELACVDARTGEILWHEKLAPDQIHASPAAGDGKLYVPMNNGSFWILRDRGGKAGPEVLSQVQLEGNCLGAPAIAEGRVWVHSTAKLYCFGAPDERLAARLQVVPSEVLARPGESFELRLRALDAFGRTLRAGLAPSGWKASTELGLELEEGRLRVPEDARPGTSVVTVSAGELSAPVRVRVVANPPFREDFGGIALGATDAEGTAVGSPPAHWIGVARKWDVRELDGEKVLAKTLDTPLFQRALGFTGHPETSNVSVRVDIRTDGNRRTMSTAGVVNQRYLIQLKGNHQEIEVSSNMERIKETVPYRWKPDTWYTLETRVDLAPDGSGVVRARVWPRDEPRPEGWNIEVEHAKAHREGAPGLFGFSPQSRFRVYVDNFEVVPNE